MVGTRTIRATLPGVAARRGSRRLPGVARAERHGEAVVLDCSDSDAAIRALLPRHPAPATSRSRGAALEQAFLAAHRARGRRAHERARLRPLRAAAHVPQPPAARSSRSASRSRSTSSIAAPEPRRERPRRHRHLGAASTSWSAWPAFGDHERRARPAAAGSPPSARSAGTASCASPRCPRGAYLARRSCSRPTSPRSSRSSLLYAAGATLGVRLPAGRWLGMTRAAARRPGPVRRPRHPARPPRRRADSIGPAVGGTTALLALLGGVWFPITGGAMQAIARGAALVLARPGRARSGSAGRGWGAHGLGGGPRLERRAAGGAAWAYRRDTAARPPEPHPRR